MSMITLTDAQAAAVRDIRDWFHNRTAEQPVYRVFGYAGTGKSTLVNHAIAELALESDGAVPPVMYATFTGKAALVLRRKGIPCRTIHSLIYSVHEATEAEIELARVELRDMETKWRELPLGSERVITEAKIAALAGEIRDMKRPRWSLNAESDVRDTRLIVLDEVSMVGPEMARDLLSFGKPILVLGDPGQLPPIKGAGAFTEGCEPDVMLTEIHRQAAESAIIRLATLAREGEWIDYGRHDDLVYKLSRRDVTPENLLNGGQVICGRNATRIELNNAMRRAAGLGAESALPLGGSAEKIICLKNDHELGLINGMFLTLDGIEPAADDRFRAYVKNEDGQIVSYPHAGNKPRKLPVYAGHFLDHAQLDPERHDRDWKAKKSLIEATYGWAITCHKAQGSAWENVIVWDDGLGRTREDRARWLYTAITRAESGLVVLD